MTFLRAGTFTVSVVRIDLLHVPDCPNVQIARERLRVALNRVGAAASVREREVGSVDAARTAGMHGSPTVLIDGVDPFATGGAEATLSCRLFRTAAGLDGAPSVEQLVEALSQ